MKPARLFGAVAILPLLGGVPTAPAKADQFGCTVLLCMSNPAGWASVPYCVFPVQTALQQLAKGKSWPQCPEAQSGSGTITPAGSLIAPSQGKVAQ